PLREPPPVIGPPRTPAALGGRCDGLSLPTPPRLSTRVLQLVRRGLPKMRDAILLVVTALAFTVPGIVAIQLGPEDPPFIDRAATVLLVAIAVALVGWLGARPCWRDKHERR